MPASPGSWLEPTVLANALDAMFQVSNSPLLFNPARYYGYMHADCDRKVQVYEAAGHEMMVQVAHVSCDVVAMPFGLRGQIGDSENSRLQVSDSSHCTKNNVTPPHATPTQAFTQSLLSSPLITIISFMAADSLHD